MATSMYLLTSDFLSLGRISISIVFDYSRDFHFIEVFCASLFACHPLLCLWGATNSLLKVTSVALEACFVNLKWFVQIVFCKCFRFIQDNGRFVTTYEFEELMFNHPHFVPNFSYSIVLHMLVVDFCYRVKLHFVSKCCWFLSTTNYKALRNMKLRLIELIIFYNNEFLALFQFFICYSLQCKHQAKLRSKFPETL